MGWKKEVAIDDETKIIFEEYKQKKVTFKIFNSHKDFIEDYSISGNGGFLNIKSGEIEFYDYDLPHKSEDLIRKAWLKVKDEIKRRGWIV